MTIVPPQTLTILSTVLVLTLVSPAADGASMLREGDEFWVIDSRGISCCMCNLDLEAPNFKVYRDYRGLGLRHDSVAGLLNRVGEDPTFLNVIYFHGNRFKPQEAIDRALTVYRQINLRRRDPAKIRWILWSWPSDPIFNPLTDVREKAARADAQTLYAGWLLRRFPALDRLEFVGYSFGGRIATGALHTAAGGSMGGRSLSGPPLRGARISVNLVAPALDHHWLANGSKHGLAVENIGSINLFYNNRDRVLQLYAMVSEHYDPVALGFAGLGSLGERSDRLPIHVRSQNCCGSVGLLHDELKYYEQWCNTAAVIARSFENSFHQPVQPAVGY